jgi:hypothetical protein
MTDRSAAGILWAAAVWSDGVKIGWSLRTKRVSRETSVLMNWAWMRYQRPPCKLRLPQLLLATAGDGDTNIRGMTADSCQKTLPGPFMRNRRTKDFASILAGPKINVMAYLNSLTRWFSEEK